jgi:excisionase family DNA binding protein
MKIERRYGIKNVAEILNISPDATRDLISKRAIAHHRIGGKIMVSESDLEAYLDRQRIAAYGEQVGIKIPARKDVAAK